MRILVVGAGATGGFFGGRLAEAGRDVTFLSRPVRAAQLRSAGLQIVSPHGDVTLQPRLVTSEQLEPEYDVVLLAVKAFSLEGALDAFAAAIGERTMILPLLYGLRHIDVLTARFGEAAVLGGVCLCGTTIDHDGRIIESFEPTVLIYGERDGSASTRIAALDDAMQGAGFDAHSSRDVVREMWEKWVVLATFGGITCLLRGTIGEIEAAPGGADFAVNLLAECEAVAAAYGYEADEAHMDRARTMITARGSMLAPSMYRDLQQGGNVEVDQIIGDLLARARERDLSTPILAAAYANLSVYQRRLAGV
jgi:2-dehydropantoate 2-reductase